MTRIVRTILVGTAAVLAAACAEKITSSLDEQILDAAFITMPIGFETSASSYSGGDGATAFLPHDRGGRRGPNGLGGGHDFMGGGFGLDFLGGAPGGDRPFDRGGFASSGNCTFSATTGIVTCGPDTRNGITTNSTIVFKTAAGVAQAKPDSVTNSVAVHTSAAGSFTRRNNAVTTVSHTSDRTVTGLASTSTQRTVNGTSAGTESTTGTDSAGAFTVARAIGDTTSGLVIPIANGKPTYPTAGTVIRSMKASVTRAGATTTSTRREVVTYDGTATAKLVITRDGTTKNCTIPLPRGRPTCS